MGEVTHIDDYRAHLSIIDIDKNAHIIPLSFFISVASGKAKITDLEDYEKIVPTIVYEWLWNLGIDAGMIKG